MSTLCWGGKVAIAMLFLGMAATVLFYTCHDLPDLLIILGGPVLALTLSHVWRLMVFIVIFLGLIKMAEIALSGL